MSDGVRTLQGPRVSGGCNHGETTDAETKRSAMVNNGCPHLTALTTVNNEVFEVLYQGVKLTNYSRTSENYSENILKFVSYLYS